MWFTISPSPPFFCSFRENTKLKEGKHRRDIWYCVPLPTKHGGAHPPVYSLIDAHGWLSGAVWSQLVRVWIFRPIILKSPSYEPKTLKNWVLLTHFSSRHCYAYEYYKQNHRSPQRSAYLNVLRATGNKHACVSWHGPAAEQNGWSCSVWRNAQPPPRVLDIRNSDKLGKITLAAPKGR